MIGQEHIIKSLRLARAANKLHHAYLFVGPTGSGKLALATWLAQLANCEGEGEKPCGVCSQCHLIAEGSHTDVLKPVPSAKSKKGHFLIEQTQDIRKEISRIPVLGRHKILILDPADKIEPDAANVLLKTLEEPPEYAILVLLVTDTVNVLPTVLSRCLVAHFKTVPLPTIAFWLTEEHGTEPSAAAKAAKLSEGRPGEALRLVTEPEALQKRDRAMDWLEQTANGDGSDALRLAEDLRTGTDEESPDVSDSLRWAGAWFRDIGLAQAGGPPEQLINADRALSINEAAQRYSPAQVVTALQAIVDTRRYLAGNANAGLALECLMMDLIPW